MDEITHDRLVAESESGAINAITEETRKYHLEYAELSPTIRELLAKIYIRGGLDVLHKLKLPKKDGKATHSHIKG